MERAFYTGNKHCSFRVSRFKSMTNGRHANLGRAIYRARWLRGAGTRTCFTLPHLPLSRYHGQIKVPRARERLQAHQVANYTLHFRRQRRAQDFSFFGRIAECCCSNSAILPRFYDFLCNLKHIRIVHFKDEFFFCLHSSWKWPFFQFLRMVPQ